MRYIRKNKKIDFNEILKICNKLDDRNIVLLRSAFANDRFHLQGKDFYFTYHFYKVKKKTYEIDLESHNDTNSITQCQQYKVGLTNEELGTLFYYMTRISKGKK